jgi:hypothetical protein
MALSVVSAVVVVWTLVAGSLIIKLDGTTVFQNRHLLRPGVLAAALAILGAWPEGAAGIGVVVLTVALLPVPAYRDTVQRFTDGTRLLRPLRDCVVRVGARPDMMAQGPRGMYVDGNGSNYENPFNHQYAYYFRTVNPWKRARATPPDVMGGYLFDAAAERPLLIGETRYRAVIAALTNGRETSTLNLAFLEPDVLLVLPGPYAACLGETAASARRRP